MLSLSVKTVSTHKSNVLQKMGMASTVDLIRYAIKRGLVGLETPDIDGEGLRAG